MSDILRMLVIAGVVLALVLGAGRERTARGGVQRIDDVVVFTDATLLVRMSVEPPDPHALDAIAGMAAVTPLYAALPPASRIAASLPQLLVAGRAAALTFFVTGTAGANERLHLLADDGEVVDSADVMLDARGRSRGAFRVRPAGEGWHEWTVRVASEWRTTGTWVLPERAPNVLIVAGPPSPESRFAARTLEEAGAQVELRQPLGRGLTAGAIAESLPTDSTELAAFDVVIVLHGAPLDDGRRAALERYVTEQGGGVLITARDPLLTRLGLAAGAQPSPRSINADDVRWSLPPELVRLPTGSVSSAAEPLAVAPDAFVAAAAGDGEALLAVRAIGHGRGAALGLRETWRWRVADDAGDDHREFWRSLVDWLAPAPVDVRIETPHRITAEGLPVAVTVETEGAPPRLHLRRPDGSFEVLPHASAGGPHHARLAFLPTDTGVYAVVAADGDVAAAVRVTLRGGSELSEGNAPAPSPRSAETTTGEFRTAESRTSASRTSESRTGEAAALLALLADASGGRALPAAALDSVVDVRRAGRPALPWRLPLLLLILAIATADWAVRRLRGAS